MKRVLTALSVCLMASTAYGTQQTPEKLLYKGQEYRLACVPLEKYFDANHPKPAEMRQTSTNCWRGYVGTWEIKDKKLYLQSLARFRGSRSMEEIPCSLVFKDQKPPIEATWYTGVLRCPQGKILRWDRLIPQSLSEQDLYISASRGGTFHIYEKDLYFGVVRGNIVSEYLVDNKGKGATQSIRDWGWVASGPGPVKDDLKWHDLRDVTAEAFSKYKKSGNSFLTRGVYVNSEESKTTRLWVLPTPATRLAVTILESVPQVYKGRMWQHVEIKAHLEKESGEYSLHVDSIRPLKPGETMHHCDFKPPEKLVEKSR